MTSTEIQGFLDELHETIDKVTGAGPDAIASLRDQVRQMEGWLQSGEQGAAFDCLARLTKELLKLHEPPAHQEADDRARMKADSAKHLTPELRQWVLSQHTTEEVIAALNEARRQGTFELKDFVDDLEKVVKDHDPTAH
jgi:hypothetical protein